MFDHVVYKGETIAFIENTVREANEVYGAGELERLNYAVRVLRGETERVRSPYPLQTPGLYLPGLTAKPWHDPGTIEQAGVIESSYETIKRELLEILRHGRGFEEPGRIEKHIVGGGSWDQFWIKDGFKKYEENWALCPETKKLIDSLPRMGESCTFSALTPGAHIKPHSGVANFRLTIQLGLIIPEDCELTVMEESRGWEEGRCIVFDDSFVHEARNNGATTRIVLIADIWHPDLSDAEVRVLNQLLAHFVN